MPDEQRSKVVAAACWAAADLITDKGPETGRMWTERPLSSSGQRNQTLASGVIERTGGGRMTSATWGQPDLLNVSVRSERSHFHLPDR